MKITNVKQLNSLFGLKTLLVFILGISLFLFACDAKTEYKATEVGTYFGADVKVESSMIAKNTVEIKGLKGNQPHTMDCFVYDELEYLSTSDFIGLLNLMNNQLRFLKQVQDSDYDQLEHTLKIVYRKDGQYNSWALSSLISESFTYEISEIDGSDYTKIVDFDDGQLKYLNIDGEAYLPLEALRNYILNDNLYLLKVADSTYEFHKDGITSLMLKKGYEKLPILNDSLFEKSIEQLGELDNLQIESKYFENYSEYYFELLKIIDQRDDYHAGVYNIAEVSQEALSTMGFDDFFPESNYMKYSELYPKNMSSQIKWEKVSDNTVYLDIDSFMINAYEFSNKIDRFRLFINENQEISDIVLDLRDNLGGYSSNAIKVLHALSSEQIVFSINNKVDNQRFTNSKYRLNNNKKKIADYNITVMLNESSMSASVFLANIMKDNIKVQIIGNEPMYKQSDNVTYHQLFDGTIISRSSLSCSFASTEGLEFNEVKLVDKTMTDKDLGDYLKGLKTNH